MQSMRSSGLQSLFLTRGTDYAITHNLTPFISMQNQYSLVYREEEREMMPSLKVIILPFYAAGFGLNSTLQHFGVGSIPWSPIGRGALTRPYTGPQAEKTARQASDKYYPCRRVLPSRRGE
jgi:aryl-alcohol dehydrogenase-like predicted oxidoreductase